MACACGAPACGCGGKFTVPTERSVHGTLVQALTPVVDCIRDLYTSLGARQYTVSLVWARWTGGERGVGHPEVVAKEMILPTPLVGALTALNNSLESVGIVEAGGIRVSEISARYAEDTLLGRDKVVPIGDPIPDDVDFYWELVLVNSGVVRKFVPRSQGSGTTALDFDWSIELVRAQDDPKRGYP